MNCPAFGLWRQDDVRSHYAFGLAETKNWRGAARVVLLKIAVAMIRFANFGWMFSGSRDT